MDREILGGFRRVTLAGAGLGLLGLLAGCATLTPPATTIAGQVGKPPVSGAVVMLCDARTGIPLNQSWRPFTETNNLELRLARTDAAGRFSFTNVPPGTYRLLAQTPIDDKHWRDDAGAEVCRLLGTAEKVRVPSRRAGALHLEPAGTGAITIAEHMPNDGTYFLISTRPTTGDPILGFLTWNDDFVGHLLGVARSGRERKLTITGLPNRGVHVALFANDDAPGFGAIQFATLPTTVQRIPIVAGWSDAEHTPPPRIRHVMDILAESHTSAERLLRFDPRRVRYGPGGPAAMVRDTKTALGPLDRKIALANGEQATVAEVLATIGYKSLQENDAKRGRGTPPP